MVILTIPIGATSAPRCNVVVVAARERLTARRAMSASARWFTAFRAAAALVLAVLVVVSAHRWRAERQSFDDGDSVEPSSRTQITSTVFVAKPELVWRAPVALDVAEQSIHESSNARDDAGATSADGSVETARELETASASVGEQDATAATTTSNATTTATATAKSDEPCALHLFRHVSKTGGTTVRFWFDRQTVLGEWEYPIPYGASREEWEALKTAWTDAARAYVNGTRAVPPRTLVEVRGHYPNSWNAQNFANVVFEDVLAMKEEFADSCSVTTSYLVRKPVDQYASYYAYYVHDGMEEEIKKEQAGESTKNVWGRSLHEWAATKQDMQTRELLWEECVHHLRAPTYEKNDKWTKDCITVSDEKWARVEALVGQFDVVGTTERFNEFLHVVGKIAGVRDLRYVFSNTGTNVDKVDKEALEVTIKNVTTRDAALYAYADAALNSAIEHHFGSLQTFRRVVDSYEAATVKHGTRHYIGGKPDFTPKYKWVKAEDAKLQDVPTVQLPMWVMPDGGGQAKAYMVQEKVVLVEREKAKAIRTCIKGCSFD